MQRPLCTLLVSLAGVAVTAMPAKAQEAAATSNLAATLPSSSVPAGTLLAPSLEQLMKASNRPSAYIDLSGTTPRLYGNDVAFDFYSQFAEPKRYITPGRAVRELWDTAKSEDESLGKRAVAMGALALAAGAVADSGDVKVGYSLKFGAPK